MRSVKLGFVAVALLLGSTALTTPAFATGNQCHSNCSPPPPPKGGDVDIDNHNTAIGVGIAKAGASADADATAVNFNANVAKGGDAHAYNKNDIDNKNTNLNANFNKNDVDIDNRDFNANVNVNKNELTNKNYNTNKQGQAQGQKQDQEQNQGQLQGQAQAVENVGNVHIENERPPVNTAYAAGLSVGEDTCMGSSSIGAQAVSFGLSIGTTWQDDNCRRLKNSRQLVALGYHRAATSLMCVDDDVRQAMIMAGTPCPNGEAVAAYVAPPAREYVPMAPVADDRPVKHKKRVRKALPPK